MPMLELILATTIAAGGAGAVGATAGASPSPVLSPRVRAAESARAPVTRARPSQVARRFVERRFGQPARVTGAEREDDFGARWEIEVTRRDGAEFDVYVSPRGTVIRIVRTPPGG